MLFNHQGQMDQIQNYRNICFFPRGHHLQYVSSFSSDPFNKLLYVKAGQQFPNKKTHPKTPRFTALRKSSNLVLFKQPLKHM